MARTLLNYAKMSTKKLVALTQLPELITEEDIEVVKNLIASRRECTGVPTIEEYREKFAGLYEEFIKDYKIDRANISVQWIGEWDANSNNRIYKPLVLITF